MRRHGYASHGRDNNPKSSVSVSTFDAESGQVYQETEIRFNRKQHSNWIGELKTPALLKRPHQNETGSRSLLDMAKIQIARRISRIDVAHMAHIPWRVAKGIYEEIESIHGESFHAWRTFAQAYSEDFNGPHYRYQLEIRRPSLPLPNYFKGITSSSLSWFTSLRISPRQVGVSDLISLAKITNLAVLDLSDGQDTIDNTVSTFNERIVRTWAELAGTESAFKHLRVLLVGWQEYFSSWIFKYLDSFPSLCYLIVTDCTHLHQRNRWEWETEALKYGWSGRHAKRSAKSLKPIVDDREFYVGAVSGGYYNSQELFEQLQTDGKPDVPKTLPVLECSIGSPKKWTHIIDEFPSTRTIWFDNMKTSSSSKTTQETKVSGPKTDQDKRSRTLEVPTVGGMRSPPRKRNRQNLTIRGPVRPVMDLLADLYGPAT